MGEEVKYFYEKFSYGFNGKNIRYSGGKIITLTVPDSINPDFVCEIDGKILKTQTLIVFSSQSYSTEY